MPIPPSGRLLLVLLLGSIDLALVASGSRHLLPQVLARSLELWVVCRALAARLHPDEGADEQRVAALLYLYAAPHMGLRLLACLGLLSNGAVALVVAIGAPLALGALGRGPPAAPLPAPAPAGDTARLVTLARLLALAGLVAWQGLNWGFAPVGWDGFTYHLDWPVQWRARGDLAVDVVQVGDPAVTFYPRASALYSLLMLLPGSDLDPLSHHLELPFLLGILLAAGLLIERMGVEPQAARLGALLVLSAPLVAQLSPNLGNDLILAFAVLAACHAAGRWAEARGPADALRFGLAAGMALATKYLGLLYLPVMLWPLLAARRRPPHLGVAVVAFLVGVLPDYGRNLLATGNPLFPASLTLGGVRLLPGLQDLSWIYAKTHFTEDFAWSFEAAARLLGPLWMVLLPACLVAPLLAGSRPQRVARAMPLLAFACFLALPHRHLRFALLVTPLALGAGLAAWARAPRPPAGALGAAAVVALMLCAFGARPDLEGAQRARFARWGAYPRYGQLAGIWEAVDTMVGERQTLLVALDVQSYTYRGPDGGRPLLRPSLVPGATMRYRDLEPPGFETRYLAWRPEADDPAAFVRALIAPGADWVLLNVVDAESQRARLEAVSALPGYRLVKQWRLARLYRRVGAR